MRNESSTCFSLPRFQTAIGVALITLLGFTWPFWLNSHLPIVSYIDGFSFLHSLLPFLFFAVTTVLVVYTIRPKKILFLVAMVILGFSATINLNIIQPYLYHLGILGTLALTKSKGLFVFHSRIFYAIIYIFSGIHKLNVHYDTFVVSFLQNQSGISAVEFPLAVLPYVEIILGLSLLIRPIQTRAHLMLSALHMVTLVVLLLSLYNPVVWVWNLFMMLNHYWLSRQKNEIQKTRTIPALVLSLALLLSCLSLVNTNFSYMGWNLYSGRIAYGYIHTEDPGKIPNYLKTYSEAGSVNLLDYSLHAYGVSINPLPRVYSKWFESIADSEPSFSFIGHIRINGFTSSSNLYYYQYQKKH